MTEKTSCCIVGGGPAGMMLGYLLARAGIHVTVLEKHADFLRDFRGDTIHPSTLELMHQLDLLEEFLQRPHQEVRALRGWVGDFEITVADFSHLPTHCKFLAFMPQWDFLNFLTEKARAFPSFHLHMQAEVTDLLMEKGNVIGVEATTPQGPLEVRADVVVGTDGRHSVVRDRANLEVQNLGAPIDVLWMQFSRKPTDPDSTLGRFDLGKILVLLNREKYWQLGYVIKKGGIQEVQQRGLNDLRDSLSEIAPFLRDRVSELKDWKDIKLLTVLVDRLTTWCRPGLLCIGDAAHAMSPVGGVGINLAIQDAVAAANVLIPAFKRGVPSLRDLQKVQKRRTFPTVMTQRLQVFIQNNILKAVFQAKHVTKLPWPLKLLQWFPVLQRIPARVVGLGFRPEKIN